MSQGRRNRSHHRGQDLSNPRFRIGMRRCVNSISYFDCKFVQCIGIFLSQNCNKTQLGNCNALSGRRRFSCPSISFGDRTVVHTGIRRSYYQSILMSCKDWMDLLCICIHRLHRPTLRSEEHQDKCQAYNYNCILRHPRRSRARIQLESINSHKTQYSSRS